MLIDVCTNTFTSKQVISVFKSDTFGLHICEITSFQNSSVKTNVYLYS